MLRASLFRGEQRQAGQFRFHWLRQRRHFALEEVVECVRVPAHASLMITGLSDGQRGRIQEEFESLLELEAGASGGKDNSERVWKVPVDVFFIQCASSVVSFAAAQEDGDEDAAAEVVEVPLPMGEFRARLTIGLMGVMENVGGGSGLLKPMCCVEQMLAAAAAEPLEPRRLLPCLSAASARKRKAPPAPAAEEPKLNVGKL